MKIKTISGAILIFSFISLMVINNKVYNDYVCLKNQNDMQVKKMVKKKPEITYKEITHTINKHKDFCIENIKKDDRSNIYVAVSFTSNKNEVMGKINELGSEKDMNNINSITIDGKDNNKACKVELMLKK